MFGYCWFVKCGFGSYEPHEETFNTLEEAMEDMKRFSDWYPIECCGVDYVNDNNGNVDVIERVIEPTAVFYDDDEDDDDF